MPCSGCSAFHGVNPNLKKITKKPLYALAPFILILWVLTKLRKENIIMTIITPNWQTQARHSVLPAMSFCNVLLITDQKDLLFDLSQTVHQMMIN